MNKFIRIINQNRLSVLIGIIIVILILSIIQVLNINAKQNENGKKEVENVQSSNNETEEKVDSGSTLNGGTSTSVSNIGTESVISGSKIPSEYKSEFSKLIKNFINNCFDEKYDAAYDALTVECKQDMYPSKEIFIDKYCVGRFVKGKKAEVKLWGTNGGYVYQVRLVNDVLSEGRGTTGTFMQDYYSVIQQNGDYKLNINGFIGTVQRNKFAEKGDLKITINYSKIYTKYEIFNVTVANKSDKDIIIDSQELTNSLYINVGEDKNKYGALLHEINSEGLVVGAKKKRILDIKFGNVYNDGLMASKIGFTKIVKNKQEFEKNKSEYKDFEEIEIDL